MTYQETTNRMQPRRGEARHAPSHALILGLLALLSVPTILSASPYPSPSPTPTPAPLRQTDDDPENDRVEYARQLVFLDSVDSYKNGGKNYVAVTGRAPDVPEGTIVDFVLTFRSMTIDTLPFSVPGSKRINAEFEIKKFPRSREKFHFRTIIDSKKQSKPVLAAIERLPKVFRPALDPWTDHHRSHSFRLLTSAEANASLEPIRAFFRERLDRVTAIRTAVAEETELAALGEKFTKSDGSFDAAQFQEYFEAEAIESLLDISVDVRAALAQSRYIPFRRSLVALESTAKSGALSCYQAALRLYRNHGQVPPPAYVKASRLELTREERRKLQTFDLAAAEELIKEELGLSKSDRVEEAFQLVGSDSYQGILFRHLTPEELANGKFDPVRAQSTWTPTSDEIETLETKLRTQLEKSRPAIARSLSNYRRQYVGIGKTKKTVHISFVHRHSPLSARMLRTVQPANSAAQVMTAQYDVAAGTFSELNEG